MAGPDIYHAVSEEGGIITSEMGIGHQPIRVIISKVMRLQNQQKTSRVVVVVDKNWRMIGTVKENTYYPAEWKWPEVH